MPNEKLPEINEHDAEELIHYPQDEEQKERRSRLLPGLSLIHISEPTRPY
mgnify:CR=1 FL=1